jgi:anti-sigma-K factor RskA
MSGHEQFGEDLALYALNALGAEERVTLENHLASCPECRLELEQLRGDGALLALSAFGPKPPARARQRLLDAVAKESSAAIHEKTARGTGRTQRSWSGWLGWVAAAAMVFLAVLLWRENAALRESLAAMSDRSEQTAKELDDLRRIAAPILSPEAQRVTLVSVKTHPQPQGKAFYLRNRSNLVFVANNMPALPPQKAYELWLIPTQGAPIPAGVFKPDARGSATVVNPPIPAGTRAKAFAITVENEAGSSTPTMPIVMMGTGE